MGRDPSGNVAYRCLEESFVEREVCRMSRVRTLQVNGCRQSIDVDTGKSLLLVLREDLGLTGSKIGCGEGECGVCTVLIDGAPVRSCITSAGEVRGVDSHDRGSRDRWPSTSFAAGFP
jgi:hypothetical protein